MRTLILAAGRLGAVMNGDVAPVTRTRRPAPIAVLGVAAAWMLLACTVAPCPEGYVCDEQGATPLDAAGGAPPVPMPTTLPPEPGPPWEDVTPPEIDRSETALDGANYGMLDVVVDPKNPATVYLTTSQQGFWRSTDSGASWTRMNTGRNAGELDRGRQWALAIDPENPEVLYTASGYGGLGIWKTVNGGIDWDQLFTDDATKNPTMPINGTLDPVRPDISQIDMDPSDPAHLIATFHDNAWVGYDDAGLVETKDGGETWVLRPPPPGFGVAHCAYFLDDGATWLVVSQSAGNGAWRTIDGGETFEKVGDFVNAVGCQIYRGDGALYIGSGGGVLRSTDNGATWKGVDDRGQDVQGIVGDGRHIYSSSGLMGFRSESYNPTQRAPENPGDRGWRTFGTDTFMNGAKTLAADRERGILYSAAWRVGVFRLSLDP